MEAIVSAISKACARTDITNKEQCQLLELACRQVCIFVELWRRKQQQLGPTSSQKGALRELSLVISRCLMLVRTYCEDQQKIILRLLCSRHNPLEFEQLAEDLWTWCRVLVDEGDFHRLIQDTAASFERDLKLSSELDRRDLVTKLQEMRENCENMDGIKVQIVDFLLDDMNSRDEEEEHSGKLFEIEFEQFNLSGKHLGQGVSGAVVDATWQGRSIALKHATRVEARVMVGTTQPCHPNVVQVFGFSRDADNEEWLALEMMDTDLKKHIDKCKSEPKKFPFSTLASIDMMLQIARGMKYLHSRGIVHRDLKPHNVLVSLREDGSLALKITDFGVSKPDFLSLEQDHTYMRGTPIYMAPEMLQIEDEAGFYHKNVDVYSFGITCSEILTGEQPFGQKHFRIAELRNMLAGNQRPTLPENCPKDLEQLISRCWDSDPSSRPSFASICEELWCLKAEAGIGFDQQLSNLRPVTPSAFSGMKNLRITGKPVIGEKLIAEAEFVQASSCICFWVREHRDGSRMRLEPFQVMRSDVTPEYVVSVEDIHSRIAIECLPVTTDSIEQWQVFSRRTPEVNYDSRTLVEVGVNCRNQHAEFKIQFKGQGWVERRATLILNHGDYQLWWSQSSRRNVREKYTSEVCLIPSKDDPVVATLNRTNGTAADISFGNTRTRDVAVVTLSKFVSNYMDPSGE